MTTNPPNAALRNEIRAELERVEEDAKHTAKCHFNAGGRNQKYHYYLGLPAVILSAISTFAFFKSYPLIGGSIATLVTTLVALQTFLKPSERANNHKASGDQYLALKNDARVCRNISLSLATDEEAVAALKELCNRRNELSAASPPFAGRDRRKAKADIERGETVYEVDKRI